MIDIYMNFGGNLEIGIHNVDKKEIYVATIPLISYFFNLLDDNYRGDPKEIYYNYNSTKNTTLELIRKYISQNFNIDDQIDNIIVSGSATLFLQKPSDISLAIIRKIFGNNHNKIYYFTLLNTFIDITNNNFKNIDNTVYLLSHKSGILPLIELLGLGENSLIFEMGTQSTGIFFSNLSSDFSLSNLDFLNLGLFTDISFFYNNYHIPISFSKIFQSELLLITMYLFLSIKSKKFEEASVKTMEFLKIFSKFYYTYFTDYLINENKVDNEKILQDISNILQTDSYQFNTLNENNVYMIVYNFYYNIKKKFMSRIINFLNKRELTFPLKVIVDGVGEYILRDLLEDLSEIDQMELIQLSNITNREVSVYSPIVGPLLKIRNMEFNHKVRVI
ncbi:hypothetical protein IC006_0998 [Sulfuracidifex tepidarius]|uniref:Uncharacterized protein n=1 Tax=Sulfuracidifex tepidarius TaxID=1294262 RepID=A0A510DUL0_9CREN|nr:hypothetical protein [Sulfuracidifex tepidarius]BBG23708.1 hypothetical protein IC006_0998 [Sulfuracidifex tepidarius]